MSSKMRQTARFAIVLTAALAAIALAVPATALAHVEPGTPAPARGDTPPALVHDNPLRDAKYLPQPAGAYGSGAAPVAADASASLKGSFRWIDVGVGAGGMLGAVLFIAGLGAGARTARRGHEAARSA